MKKLIISALAAMCTLVAASPIIASASTLEPSVTTAAIVSTIENTDSVDGTEAATANLRMWYDATLDTAHFVSFTYNTMSQVNAVPYSGRNGHKYTVYNYKINGADVYGVDYLPAAALPPSLTD